MAMNMGQAGAWPPVVLSSDDRAALKASFDVDAAGLKVVKFWSVGAEVEGLVEAVLKY